MLLVNAGEMECSPWTSDELINKTGDKMKAEKGAAKFLLRDESHSRDHRLHDLTHCPARLWCKYCVYGASAEYRHRTVVGENGESTVPRVMLDYCFFKEDASRLTDEHVNKEEAKVSLTALAMKETMCDSV